MSLTKSATSGIAQSVKLKAPNSNRMIASSMPALGISHCCILEERKLATVRFVTLSYPRGKDIRPNSQGVNTVYSKKT